MLKKSEKCMDTELITLLDKKTLLKLLLAKLVTICTELPELSSK